MKVEFTFNWRGSTKQWGQLYHFTGPTSWADQTHFDTFAVNFWNSLKLPIPARNTCTTMTAYNAGSFLPVFTHSISAAGAYTDTSNPQAPGESCMLLRFLTDQRTTKNHPIYLFKWFHGMQTNGATDPDTLRSGIHSTGGGLVSDLLAGYSDGTNTRIYCGPRGAVAQSGWVCSSPILPGIAWFSSYDQSREFPQPITCQKLDKPQGSSYTSWASFWKIIRLIEDVP